MTDAARKALTPSPTPCVRPAESAVVLTLIDALTGLESSYEEGEGVSYARLEARSAIKTAQDFLASPTPYVRPAAGADLFPNLEQPQCDQCGHGLVMTFDGLRCESCGADQNPNGGLVDLAKAGEVARKFYRRPAAEIRAEIERLKDDLSKYRSVWGTAHCEKISWRIAALEWTLTPPTQEPR